MKEMNDERLYEKIQQRDKKALEALYDKYEKLLYSFSYKMTKNNELAEEVVQEVFIKLWKGNGSYSSDKGKFSSWLLTVTRNTALDVLRKKKRNTAFELEDRDMLKSNEETVEEQVTWKEDALTVRKAVSKLKKEQQKIIELFYFKGLTQRTIAEKCGIPLGTVKGRIRLALKHLKESIEEERGSEG
ncbi:RNA polymerase sigma factor [Pseudalkalibacillus caeni]|uniref:Sigma-70 family RNA polymerase sigma factor n=1 Tax=Exobacillus caeni TaxID=2574798 RepID=A0A5R9F657_9BACL|nr:sigma-70 family RNA polymerase sigma factor [Pseudalkalibacillus caeni]TLS35964.1 sigma-70 family RNA polymerase sigma factor [Pseudalkalibacillus caeni]